MLTNMVKIFIDVQTAKQGINIYNQKQNSLGNRLTNKNN